MVKKLYLHENTRDFCIFTTIVEQWFDRYITQLSDCKIFIYHFHTIFDESYSSK